MSNRQGSSIRHSRSDDLAAIKKWLQEEETQEIDGNFWCNWSIIDQAHRKGGLLVFIDGATREPVAFQVGGLLNPGILQVRFQHRARGIGRKIVEHCIKAAKRKGEHLLYIQCKPSTSIPFWERMGFSLIPNSTGKNYAWRSIPKPLRLPDNGKTQRVIIRFYPEEKKWGDDVSPYQEDFPEAKLVRGNAIAFDHRVLFHKRQHGNERDVVVGIEVEGESRYLDKAKYPNAHRIGVRQCINGWYLDGLTL